MSRGLVAASSALLMVLSMEATAVNLCREPSRPACLIISGKDIATSQRQHDFCKMQVEDYAQHLADWLKCNREHADEEMEKTVEQFNCYASGKSICF